MHTMDTASRLLSRLIMAAWLLGWSAPQWVGAQEPRTLEECACIQDDAERLACYDHLAGRKTEASEVTATLPPGEQASPLSTPQGTITGDAPSYLTRHWELDASKPRGHLAFMSHRDTYIMPLTYNISPNRTPGHTGEVDTVQEAEAAFQVSMKVKLWQDILGEDLDLWFGYTQRSFWQVYATDDSSPFRETNYEPEVLLSYRINKPLLGGQLRMATLGLNHQSNGRAEPLSRSWNRLLGSLGWEYRGLVIQYKTWYRLPEKEDEDDNPDILTFMGPGELWVHYNLGGHRLGAMWRNNCRLHDNRGALQLDWAFPLGRKLKGYVQYFTGYGESLLDYDHPVDRIGLGVILDHWYSGEAEARH